MWLGTSRGQFPLLVLVLAGDLQSLKSDFSCEKTVTLGALLLFLCRARNQSPEQCFSSHSHLKALAVVLGPIFNLCL